MTVTKSHTYASLAAVTFGQGFSWPSAAIPKLQDGSTAFALTKNEISWVVALVFIGSTVSAVPGSLMMDKIGRRNALIVGLLFNTSSWILMAFAANASYLLGARFILGIANGIVFTAAPVYICEVADPNVRKRVSPFIAVTFFIGVLYESLVSSASYQNLNLISVIPSVALLIAFLFLPESPYYYLRQEQQEKAKQSIVWLKGEYDDNVLTLMQSKVKEQMKLKGTFFDIFRTRAGRKAFLIVEVLYFAQRLSGISLIPAYISQVIPDSWVPADKTVLVLTIVWILGSLLTGSIANNINNKTLLAVSCVGNCLGMGGVAAWLYLREFTNLDLINYLPLLFLLISGVFFSIGLFYFPTITVGELYPTNVKSVGAAAGGISANVFSFSCVLFFNDINSAIGVYFNFLIMALVSLVTAIFTCTVMVETRGRTLEEIQDILNGNDTSKDSRSDINVEGHQ